MDDDRKRVTTGQYVLLLVVAALFFGLATVGVEALAPVELPPSTALGWLGTIIAVVLAAFAFSLSAFLNASPEKLFELFRRSRDGLSQKPGRKDIWSYARFWGAFLLLTTVTMGVLLAYEPPRPAAPVAVGGLDLAKYCSSYDFNSNDVKSCSRAVDLTEACNWQKQRDDLEGVYKSADLHSGICLDPKGKDVGGIDDMLGFCRQKFKRTLDVRASDAEGMDWRCVMDIDKDVVCIWQYSDKSLTAVQENGLWVCRRPADAASP